MSGCLYNLTCTGHFDWDSKRNTYSAIIAGFFYFLAIWLMIDTAIITKQTSWTNYYFILTITSTIAMIMVNSVSNGVVQGTTMNDGILDVKSARLWLMFGFIASFASVIAGVWIMFSDFVFFKGNGPVWPGVAIFFHAFFIFGSSLVYKFGRTEELWE